MLSIKKYLSLVKFSHTIFAMPFALIGFFLGLKSFVFSNTWNLNKKIGWQPDNVGLHFALPGFTPITFGTKSIILLLSLVVLCMIFARSAAMAFNRWLDAKYDAMNPRTAVREIPAGIIKPTNALLFTVANCLLFIACCFFINRLCF